jgi:hypothetical protein
VGDHRDYSGTPLWRKLGIVAGARVLVSGAPDGFDAAMEALAPLPDGVTFLARPGRDLDVIVAFTTRRADLRKRFLGLARAIPPAGRLWIAWPKKAAAIATDLDFDAVQRTGLDAGLVDNKSASITWEYQGLQFVIRRHDRPRVR